MQTLGDPTMPQALRIQRHPQGTTVPRNKGQVHYRTPPCAAASQQRTAQTHLHALLLDLLQKPLPPDGQHMEPALFLSTFPMSQVQRPTRPVPRGGKGDATSAPALAPPVILTEILKCHQMLKEATLCSPADVVAHPAATLRGRCRKKGNRPTTGHSEVTLRSSKKQGHAREEFQGGTRACMHCAPSIAHKIAPPRSACASLLYSSLRRIGQIIGSCCQ